MEEEKDKANEDMIYHAFKHTLKVHLILRDRTFRNGYVKSVSPKMFIFFDDIKGDEALFYLNLFDVKPFQEVKNGI